MCEVTSVVFRYLLLSLSLSALQSSSWQGKWLVTSSISTLTFSSISDYYSGVSTENLSPGQGSSIMSLLVEVFNQIIMGTEN